MHTDKEAALIMADRNKESRKVNFEAFYQRVLGEAKASLADRIAETWDEQSRMIKKIINRRLAEVERNAADLEQEYAKLLNDREKSAANIGEAWINAKYRLVLSVILLSRIKEAEELIMGGREVWRK